KWIEPAWGSLSLTDITPLNVKTWLKSLSLARATKARFRNLLSALFSHAKLYSFYQGENPISAVVQSGKRMAAPGILTVEQLRQLLAVLGLRERLLILLDGTTGLRRSELAGLQWQDFDFVNHQVMVNRSFCDGEEGCTKTEA